MAKWELQSEKYTKKKRMKTVFAKNNIQKSGRLEPKKKVSFIKFTTILVPFLPMSISHSLSVFFCLPTTTTYFYLYSLVKCNTNI